MTPAWRPRRRSLLALLGWGALAASAPAGCADARDLFAPYQPLDQEVRAMTERPLPKQADVALVLGCPADPDGQPSECQRCKVRRAVELYRRGLVSHVLMTGGAAHTEVVEADTMADLAIADGVPRELVLREGRALTTWQNLRYSLRMLRERRLETIIVVSTRDHLPRVRRMLDYYGVAERNAFYAACD